MQQMNILCASGSLCSRVTVWLRLFHFGAGSEIQNNPEQITGACSFPVTACTSSAYLSFGINSEEVCWKKYNTLKILVHPRCVILFFCTTPPVLLAQVRFKFTEQVVSAVIWTAADDIRSDSIGGWQCGLWACSILCGHSGALSSG